MGGVGAAVQHHGKEMSYNNYLDADAAYSAGGCLSGWLIGRVSVALLHRWLAVAACCLQRLHNELPWRVGCNHSASYPRSPPKERDFRPLSMHALLLATPSFPSPPSHAACDFAEPTCVIVKHTNPCGVASKDDLLEAYRLAVRADPISAFGGIVAFNR
jgi:hypothetical protein